MSVRQLVIVGGGPVGLSAALAAASHGLDTVVLDAHADELGSDARVFALAYGARLILERLGAWDRLAQVHPIHSVHVSQRGALGHTLLDARELGIDALGYVVTQAELIRALRERADQLGIERRTGARVTSIEERGECAEVRYESNGKDVLLAAQIVAQADGGPAQRDATRSIERGYGQSAVIGELRCARAASDRAYERFTPRGPIALLPRHDRHALIWTVPEADADRLLALADAEFERALALAYGERIGPVSVLGARFAFPLRLRFVHRVAGTRIALIGNAAQTLHPVAGQGFNLGLRDAYELARTLAEGVREQESLAAGLRRYRSRRRIDRAGGTFFTDFLVRAFSNDLGALARARGAGLVLLDAFDPAKKLLMRRMIFGASG